jgi:hypothetical protein
LNLRPPGPQPERSGYGGCDSALCSDVTVPELLSLALASHPGLHPARMFGPLRLGTGSR